MSERPVRTTTKITVQEKIAELERRIQALEAQRAPIDAYSRTTVRQTTTTEPLTPTQQGHLDKMWNHFSETFAELGKVFR